MRKVWILIAALIFSQNIYAQYDAFQKQSFAAKAGVLPYRILYPKDFDSTKTYPVLYFLHGRGESGKDNEKQLSHGASLFIQANENNQFPAIIIFPQCPEDSYWSNVIIREDAEKQRTFDFQRKGKPSVAMAILMDFISNFDQHAYINPQQIYIGGLSMGGMGTLEILRRKPNLFAAAIVICGGDNPKNVKKYAHNQPIWLFHGEKDDVVNPAFAHAIVEKLKATKADYKATFYPNDNHNSWDSAFAEKDLLPWLFSKKKN